MAAKLIPEEGAIFAVPLESSGYAIGVLARTNRKGSAFGYFFLAAADVNHLNINDSNLIALFGDYGLHTGRWKVIGRVENWSRANWPLPLFMREHDNPDLVYLTQYSDALKAISETIVRVESTIGKGLPVDAQYGSGVIEKMLSGKAAKSRQG